MTEQKVIKVLNLQNKRASEYPSKSRPDLGTSDPLTPDVPPSATYLFLDSYVMLPRLLIARFLPSGAASVPHDLVDDEGRTISQISKSRPP